jgi:DNA mismatch repair protein MutL
LIETSGTAGDMHVVALIGPPSRTRADTTRMLFFLNGRHVRDRTLLHAARHAYEDLIFGARQPYVFVFLTMDPAGVDQNVHPAKLEVRFRDSGAVHSLVSRTLRAALTAADLAHPVRIPESEPGRDREERIHDAIGDYLGRAGVPERNLFSGGVPGAGRPSAGGEIGRAVDFLQVRDTYVILETDEGITILDQHALHERVLYDRFKSRFLAGEVAVQRFLAPAVVELTPVEIETVLSAREELRAIGVLVDEFGVDAVAVRGLPAAAGNADPLRIVEGLVERLSGERAPGREELVENLLATLACRAAVKAGDRLRREEVADLLRAAEALTHAHTCPHGRPTSLSLSYGSLERHFKRK